MQPTLYHHHNYHFFIAFVLEMFIGCLLETPSPNYLICLFLTSSITHRTRVLKQNESVQSQHRTFKNVAEKGRERFRKRLQVRSVNRTLCIVCNTILIAHISERNQDSPVYFLCAAGFSRSYCFGFSALPQVPSACWSPNSSSCSSSSEQSGSRFTELLHAAST